MPPPVRHGRFPLPATSSWGFGGRLLLLGRLAAVDQRLEVRARPELRDPGHSHAYPGAGRAVTRRAGRTPALLGNAETAWRVAGDEQGGHPRRQAGPGRCRSRAQATRPVSGRRLRPVPESPPAAGTPAHLPGQVPRQPATGSVIRSLQRSRTQVRSWEQNGSGGPLPGTVRSGHRAWLDVSDVQRHRITAVSPGCPLSSHRRGQGDFGRSVEAAAAARAADLSRHAQRRKNPASDHDELPGDANPITDCD